MGGITLYIKHMVCQRCIKVVRDVLNAEGITPITVKLGEAAIAEPLSPQAVEQLSGALEAEGFELIDDKRARLISAIKSALVELIHYGDLEAMQENISDYLSGRLHKDYHYLSGLFSESENVTIEQFVILQKIEKVKELLVYDELSLSEIAFKMGYSSVAHLSAQFKKITGFNPTQFKRLKDHNRRSLDQL